MSTFRAFVPGWHAVVLVVVVVVDVVVVVVPDVLMRLGLPKATSASIRVICPAVNSFIQASSE